MSTGIKKVVTSNLLSAYKIPKAQQAVIDKQTKLDQYMQSAGHKRAPYIRLFRHDCIKIDAAIRSQPEGKFNISTVLLDGRRIIAEGDPEPSFNLEG